MMPTPAMPPEIHPLGILVEAAVLEKEAIAADLLNLGLQFITVSRSILVSLICLGLGLGAARP